MGLLSVVNIGIVCEPICFHKKENAMKNGCRSSGRHGWIFTALRDFKSQISDSRFQILDFRF